MLRPRRSPLSFACRSFGLLVGWLAAAVAVAQDGPPQFVNDVLPILTRHGCNGGGCHGRATGQNGFKLSLFGFDPEADYSAIAEDGQGRRVEWNRPERSLLLRKAIGEADHGGGERFPDDSSAYRLLARWIAAGTPWGPADAPALVAVAVEPAVETARPGRRAQLRAIAKFSDGTVRDVTETAEFLNQTPDRLTLGANGELQVLDRPGEGLAAVRYQGLVALSRWTIPYRDEPPESAYAEFRPAGPIDELVLRRWRQLGIVPSGPATDAEFLRRATLDVTGTLPAPAEIREFLADTSADKRERLVDRLLERPEYSTYWAQKWGDVLRNRQGDAAQQDNSRKFTQWIKASLASNMPFDQFARALIAATGKLEEQPQIDWYRQLNSPQNRVEDVSQVFLGLRVSCANCHDHPLERISQNDYWRFAAFFARTDAISYGTVKTIGLKKEGETLHPRTGRPMTPRPFGGVDMPYADGEDARLKLVDWLTARENPYFARTLVNRLWAHYLKRGLVEPVDDHRATNPPTNPELLDELARQFVASGYDIKQLTRVILRSRTYGLSSQPRPENVDDQVSYARHYPQRLPPHVLYDAVHAATGQRPKFQQAKEATRAIELPNEFEPDDFLDIFGRTKRDTPCVCETRLEPNLSQVLYLLFSPELQQALTHADGLPAKLVKDGRPTVEIVDELYLRTLSRPPSDADRADAARIVDEANPKQAAVEDLLWTLLNSKAFLFNH